MKQFDKREVIAGFLVLFVGVLIGSFWLSDVATPAVAFFTSIGALATAFTLGFLVWQNSQQAKRLDKQEEHQLNMWKEQREMLVFQKLQTHKSLFNDLLDEIERNNKVAFYDRTGLYKKFFPKNGFEEFSATLDLDDKTSYIQSCIEHYQRIKEDISDCKSEQSDYHVFSLLNNIYIASYLFHLTIPKKQEFGDIRRLLSEQENNLIINIFTPEETISTYEVVLQKLCDFTGIQYSSTENVLHCEFLRPTLLEYSLSNEFQFTYIVNFGNVRSALNDFYNVYQYVTKSTFPNNQDLNIEIFKINIMFTVGLKDKNELKAISMLEASARSLYNVLSRLSESTLNPETETVEMLQLLDNSVAQFSERIAILNRFKQ